MNTAIIILAAGQGTRMHSSIPKVLHKLANKPLLQRVLTAATSIAPKQIIVVCGHEAQQIKQTFAAWPITWAFQPQQLGTGDAVRCALPYLATIDKVLILYGDVPLIEPTTLSQLIKNTPANAVGLLTVAVDKPYGFGRIIRNKTGQVLKIVEEQDATAKEQTINEINPGIYLLPANKLSDWVGQLATNNTQKEFYLTDIIALAVKDSLPIYTETVSSVEEVLGVNTRSQLIHLERHYQRKQADKFLQQGVTILDPARFDIRGDVSIAADVTIDVNVILEGTVTIANNVSIGSNVVIKDSAIGEGTAILPNSVIDSATIGSDCQIGPFARIRPATTLKDKVKIGNFVEIKNSIIETGSKANHLSYLGDATIGSEVNIGAGVITCNYDGANKHKTIIGNNVAVGADTQLIAPITIGAGATIAAGTTVIKDIPEGTALVLNKKQQQIIENWQRPTKIVNMEPSEDPST